MTTEQIEASVAAYRARCENPKAEVEYWWQDEWNTKDVPAFDPAIPYRLKPAPKVSRRPLTQDEWARQQFVDLGGIWNRIDAITAKAEIVFGGHRWDMDQLVSGAAKRTDGTIGPDGKLVWLPCYVEETEGGAK